MLKTEFKKRNLFSKIFEFIMWKSRLMVLIAVLISFISAFILILIGCLEVFYVFKQIYIFLLGQVSLIQLEKYSLVHIISAVESFLTSNVLIIFAFGLYELFINKIIYLENNRENNFLVVHSLDQLKDKIANLIIMVMIVTFFKYSLNLDYKEISSLFILSLGILVITISLYLIGKKQKLKKSIKH